MKIKPLHNWNLSPREATFMKDFNFKVFSSLIWIFLIFLMVAGVTSCGQMAESHSVNIANTEQLTNANSERTEAQTEKIEVQNKDNSDNSKIADVSADDSIKQTDFKNFSYPWGSKIARLKDTVTLKDGKAEIIKKNGKLVATLTTHTRGLLQGRSY